MGDLCSQNDLDRLMRSPEGKAYLEEIRAMLKGRTIIEVSFSNETHFISTTLHLDDGETFAVFQPSLEVDALRDEFADVIQREYYVDYPERRYMFVIIPSMRTAKKRRKTWSINRMSPWLTWTTRSTATVLIAKLGP